MLYGVAKLCPLLVTPAIYVFMWTHHWKKSLSQKDKIKQNKKQAQDLLVLLVEHLLDHHTGEELETGYFL